LSKANQKNSAPTIWLTSVVHLRLGVPWCWWWGKGNANERWHLRLCTKFADLVRI